MSRIDRYKIESEQDWREWAGKIPYIKCLDGWEFQPIPPFAGAMARFQVRKGENKISVYLDVDDSLGCWGSPYWEICPGPCLGDIWRCDMDKTFALQDAIARTFAALESR